MRLLQISPVVGVTTRQGLDKMYMQLAIYYVCTYIVLYLLLIKFFKSINKLFVKTSEKSRSYPMSKAAWITLGLSCTFTTSLIYLVHRQQRVEKQVQIMFEISIYLFVGYEGGNRS